MIEQNFLLLAFTARHMDLDFLYSPAVLKAQRQMHSLCLQLKKILLLCAAKAAAARAGPDRFQQIRLALRIIAVDQIPLRMREQFDPVQIAESFRFQ